MSSNVLGVGATNTYTYNGLGARTQKVDSSGTRNYLRSGASAFSSILSDGAANYTGVISERRGGDSRFYHLDGTPSNGKETNSSESTTSTRTWDAWGNQQSSSGSTQSPFGWGGGGGFETDSDSGLIHVGGFFLDPTTGRSLIGQIRDSIIQSGSAGLPSGNGYSVGNPMSLYRLKAWVHGKSGRAKRGEPINPDDPEWTPPLGGLGLSFGTMPPGPIDTMTKVSDTGAIIIEAAPGVAAAYALGVAEAEVIGWSTRGVFGLIGAVSRKACFTAGTPVVMADGTSKPIEEVKQGDWVMSRDSTTGETQPKPVTRTFTRQACEIVDVRLSNGDTIEATPEHPFWVEKRGWVAASSLEAGWSVATWDGSACAVEGVEWRLASTRVYNLEVAEAHTYFVGRGDSAVWVHNTCGPYRYEPKVWTKPGAYHNFPSSFDELIMEQGAKEVKDDGWTKYVLKGWVNGREGLYEIGGYHRGGEFVIDHRFFQPLD